MELRPTFGRKAFNYLVNAISTLSALIGIIFLAWILIEVVKRGFESLNPDMFTKLPAPPGVPGGGLANAILGSLVMTVLATAIGVPIGMMSGVYLAEFGKNNIFAKFIRFNLNVLMGIPSIIIGLFIYTFMVLPSGNFSGYAGAAALAVIMIPVVARTTEDMLCLVPNSLRESALAVGAPQWMVILGIAFRAAKHGMITGILLAVARVSGESAPLLFTAMNNPYWPVSLNQPTANLTVTIFQYAMSPFPDWQKLAWGASLLITTAVLFLTVLARIIIKDGKR